VLPLLSLRVQAVQHRLLDLSDASDVYAHLTSLPGIVGPVFICSALLFVPQVAFVAVCFCCGLLSPRFAFAAVCFRCDLPLPWCHTEPLACSEVDVDMLLSLATCLKEEAQARQLL
jgi:hypothetical protein